MHAITIQGLCWPGFLFDSFILHDVPAAGFDPLEAEGRVGTVSAPGRHQLKCQESHIEGFSLNYNPVPVTTHFQSHGSITLEPLVFP